MIYFHRLASALTSEEIEKLSTMPLTEKEAVVCSYLLENRNEDIPAIKEISGKLNLTDGHFRKICSSLMPKAFEALGLNIPIEKFGFLCHRMRHDVLRHEVKMQTKRWEKSGETEELQKLYRYVIELFINMDLSGYDEKYI